MAGGRAREGIAPGSRAARCVTRPPLLVFSDDWGRHPSSCQHLIRHLLPPLRGRLGQHHRHAPAAARLGDGAARAGEGPALDAVEPAPSDEPLPPHLRVLSPRMWPWLRLALRPLAQPPAARPAVDAVIASCPATPIAVTTLPIIADLVGVLPVTRLGVLLRGRLRPSGRASTSGTLRDWTSCSSSRSTPASPSARRCNRAFAGWAASRTC